MNNIKHSHTMHRIIAFTVFTSCNLTISYIHFSLDLRPFRTRCSYFQACTREYSLSNRSRVSIAIWWHWDIKWRLGVSISFIFSLSTISTNFHVRLHRLVHGKGSHYTALPFHKLRSFNVLKPVDNLTVAPSIACYDEYKLDG